MGEKTCCVTGHRDVPVGKEQYVEEALRKEVLALFISGQTLGGIVFLVLAFLISPYGIPAIAEWLVDKLHNLNFALRGFITG